MNIHQQYNLVFKIIGSENSSRIPVCEVNNNNQIPMPSLQVQLAKFLSGMFANYSDVVDSVSEEIDMILNGPWAGNEQDGDNIFISETNECVRLDLNDGYAYFGYESYGWNELPKIPLIDLKAICEEWIAFKKQAYNTNW